MAAGLFSALVLSKVDESEKEHEEDNQPKPTIKLPFVKEMIRPHVERFKS